jgi:TonB family protein
VDVRVYVSETGKVEFAEASGGSDRQDLAAAAVYAARQWQFAPAQQGSEKVAGEAVLHFVFVPPLNNKR